MWKELKRVIKPNGAIVMTASQPFTSVLVMSNIKEFKYTWVWEKSKASNFLQAKYMPLKAHEDLVVFCRKGKPTFNHQYTYGKPYDAQARVVGTKSDSNTEVYNDVPNPLHRTVRTDGRRNPRTVQYFPTAEVDGGGLHPTQKPVALMEYLIKTYTNENETILDFTMGSGTTGVAAANLKRNFIGIELDEKYYAIARKRIQECKSHLTQKPAG
jgi:site-specific DNA-methyltransferase (adenine-specific)